jgi:hypothetical protein
MSPLRNPFISQVTLLSPAHGAAGYGLSNSLEEVFVRRRPLYEVVGQMGFWGMLISGIQGAGLEHQYFKTRCRGADRTLVILRLVSIGLAFA